MKAISVKQMSLAAIMTAVSCILSPISIKYRACTDFFRHLCGLLIGNDFRKKSGNAFLPFISLAGLRSACRFSRIMEPVWKSFWDLREAI